MWIADANRSREIDRRASAGFGIPSRALMEAAGQAAFGEIRGMVGPDAKIAVLCGRGNNGGDGFVVARLAAGAGCQVRCLLAGTEPDLRGDARGAMLDMREAGVQVEVAMDPAWTRALDELSQQDLIVDALLGTGASGEVHGVVAQAIAAANASGKLILALDIPSGIACDTGSSLGCAVRATRTITFGLPKPFLFQGDGLEHSGTWKVAPIGFPPQLLEEPTPLNLLEASEVVRHLPQRKLGAHKGSSGHLLIVAGSPQMPGAAALVARAALRAGAGLVTLAAHPSVLTLAATSLPEILLMSISGADDAPTLLAAMKTVNAAVFGPGLGRSSDELLRRVWSSWTKPCCIDADALNACASGLALPPAGAVLTPHPGEMGRLLGAQTSSIQRDRFRAVRTAAERYGKVALLKGAYTAVAGPGSPVFVNPTGNPGMATGGMGDVLSGVVGALLAAGVDPLDAACLGGYWHGLAADLCAEEVGAVGFTASEVANALPRARARISLSCDVSPP